MKTQILIVVGFAIAVRLLILFNYGPVAANDTPGYERMAIMLRTGDYSEYDAWRTPGYPLFLNAVGNSPHNVMLAQAFLGVATIVIIYLLAYATMGLKLAAVSYAIFVGSAFNIVFIDSYLLTESFSTFLFTSLVAMIILSDKRCKQATWMWPLGAGLISAYLTITRPQYIAVLPVVVLWLIFQRRDASVSERVVRMSTYAMAAAIPVLCLVIFNYMLLGKPLLSTTIGHNITQHTLPFIESASKADSLGVIPEMIKLRDAHWDYAQKLGDNRAFIPRPHIEGTRRDSSDYYLQLSMKAIKNNPVMYLHSAYNAWLRFWRVSLLYDSTYVRSLLLDSIVSHIWIVQKLFWLLLNVLFIISALLMTFSLIRCRTIGWYECVIVMILAVSVLQALVEYGDNSRYAIPVQPAVGFIALYSICVADKSRTTIACTLQWFRSRGTTESEA